jgi:hypothetical protein
LLFSLLKSGGCKLLFSLLKSGGCKIVIAPSKKRWVQIVILSLQESCGDMSMLVYCILQRFRITIWCERFVWYVLNESNYQLQRNN